MRLLHIITGLDSDGAERMLQRLIESHNDNPRFRHTVCSLTTQGRLGAQMRARGVEVWAAKMRTTPPTSTSEAPGSRASRRAVASPIPLEAPVIRHTPAFDGLLAFLIVGRRSCVL